MSICKPQKRQPTKSKQRKKKSFGITCLFGGSKNELYWKIKKQQQSTVNAIKSARWIL